MGGRMTNLVRFAVTPIVRDGPQRRLKETRLPTNILTSFWTLLLQTLDQIADEDTRSQIRVDTISGEI